MWTLFRPLVRTFALNEVRHLATFVAGLIGAWLMTRGVDQSAAANISQGVAMIVIGGGGYLFSQWFDARRPPAAIALPDGHVIEVGKASNVSPAGEVAETRALNQAQLK